MGATLRLTHVEIKNFRAHSHTALPLHQLGCLIGENNAGKSSILHAIRFALDDKRLNEEDFQDRELPVSVKLSIEDITEADLSRLEYQHREKVRGMLRDGTLTIVRSQTIGEKPVPEYMKLGPADPDLSEERLGALMKGKTGANLRNAVIKAIPQLENALPDNPNQKTVKEAWKQYVKQLPKEELKATPTAYPTGIPQAIKPLLPSVIYVEAVKEASAEAKATGTSAFGKLMTLLLQAVTDEYDVIAKDFRTLDEKFNRKINEDGSENDNRLDAVREVESTIEGFIKERFPDVSLRMRVPSPTLDRLLSETELRIDDGHSSSIASKGATG